MTKEQTQFRFVQPPERTSVPKPKPITLAAARQTVLDKLEDGSICPCCDQFAKLYKRKLNSQIARWIIWLVQEYEANPRWVDWHEAPATLRGGDYAKAAHWGLIVNCPNTDDSLRSSGLWKPTEKGIDFAHGRISVASHVYIYNNSVHGLSDHLVTIQECLGSKFNYRELMGS